MASRGSHVGGDDGNGDGDDAMSSLDFLATSPPSNGPGSPSPFTPPPLGLSSSNSLYGLDFVNSARHSASSSAGGSDAPAQTKTIQIRAAETNSFPLAQGSNENVINHQDDDQQQQEGEEEEELLFSPSVVSATPSEMTTPLSTSGAAPLPSLSPLLLTNPESVSFASRNSRRPHRPPRVPSNMRFIGGGGGGRSVDAAGSTTPTSRGILQPQPSRHTRAWSYGSYGDSSLMSSLTDSSFEQQQQQVPTNNHLQMDNYSSNNKVYGMDFVGVPSSLQQPILYEGPSSRLAQRSTLTSNHHHHDSLQEPILNSEINRSPTKESSRREESGVRDVGKRSDERLSPTLKQLHQGVSSSEASSGGGGSINAKMQSTRLLDELLLEHHGEFEAEAEANILIALEQEAGQTNEVNVPETPSRPRTPNPVVKDRSKSKGHNRPEVLAPDTTIRPGLAATATKGAAGGPAKKQPELASGVSKFLALQKALAERIISDGSDGNNVVGADHQDEAQHAGDFLVQNYGRLWNTARQSRKRRRHTAGTNHQTGAPLENGTISEQFRTEKSSLGCSEEENAVPLDAAEEGRSVLSPEKYAHKVGTVAEETMRQANELRSDWEHFDEFIRLRQISWWGMIARALVVMLLSVAIAAGLFYGAGNPPTGTRENRDNPDSSLASASWWLIFIGVRHNFALLLAHGMEFLLVDFFALSSPSFVRLVGPRTSLLIASSKGWPGVLFLYSFISMVTLYGHDRFSSHWLYWQDSIDLFNDNNPSGDVTARSMYVRWLILFAVVSFLVSAKRLWMGHHLGRRLVSRYKVEVASLVDKLTTIGELASLALNSVHLQGGGKSSEAKQGSTEPWTPLTPRDEVKDQNVDVGSGGSLDSSRPELMDLLDDWSEPDKKEKDQLTSDTSQEILEFHQAYMLIVAECPFSLAFGPVESRAACLQSSSQLFDRLVSSQSSDEDVLLFDTLNSASARSRNAMDRERMKKLVKIFRPNRSGRLNRLDFIRSIDKVYRDLRTLAANIHNSTVLDKAYGRICDVVFYMLLSVVSLPIVGIDPLAITVSVISVLATFAFMIGSASSSFFEGVLLILLRRPFDIGDKIAVSDVETEPNGDGSNGWLVENIDLFTTTVRYGMTAERATIANGTLARCRIINMKRSESAEVRIRLKFGVEVPFQKIRVFRRAVERFVRERNQEWIGVTSFRSTAIQSDLGFVEYVLVLQSRDSWQQSLSVLESKAAVSSFCLELQKKLDIRYVAPPLPVNLDVGVQDENSRTARQRNDGGRSRAKGMEEERVVGVGGEGALAEGIASLARLFETKKDK